MKDIIRLVLVFFFAISIPCKGEDVPIKGWIILSDNMDNAITTIKAAKGYKINHLQLSHQIIHNLMEVKNESVRNQVRNLTRLAHQEELERCLFGIIVFMRWIIIQRNLRRVLMELLIWIIRLFGSGLSRITEECLI